MTQEVRFAVGRLNALFLNGEMKEEMVLAPVNPPLIESES